MTPAPVLLLNGTRVLVQGKRQALVASRSHPGEWHTCEADAENRVACSCIGYQTRGYCWHAQLITDWLVGRLLVEIEHEADTSET